MISRKIPTPAFFRDRVAKTNDDLLRCGVIVNDNHHHHNPSPAASRKARAADKSPAAGGECSNWGREYLVNNEGYDKAMLPPRLLRRILSAAAGEARNEGPPLLACGYIPTSFRPRQTPAGPAGTADRLDSSFTVWKFFALSPELARRCAAAGRPAVGKLLKLRAADCPGPYFLVALPNAGVDDSDIEGGDEDADGAAGPTRASSGTDSESPVDAALGPPGCLPARPA